MMCNKLAKDDPHIRSAIMDMCEANGIAYDNCYDLVHNVGPVGTYRQEMVLPGPAAEAQVFEEPNNWLF